MGVVREPANMKLPGASYANVHSSLPLARSSTRSVSPTFSSRSSTYTFPPRTAGPPKPAANGTVQSTFGPSCGHVRRRPFCSEVWFRRGPYSDGQSAAKTVVSDSASMIVTSLACTVH